MRDSSDIACLRCMILYGFAARTDNANNFIKSDVVDLMCVFLIFFVGGGAGEFSLECYNVPHCTVRCCSMAIG